MTIGCVNDHAVHGATEVAPNPQSGMADTEQASSNRKICFLFLIEREHPTVFIVLLAEHNLMPRVLGVRLGGFGVGCVPLDVAGFRRSTANGERVVLDRNRKLMALREQCKLVWVGFVEAVSGVPSTSVATNAAPDGACKIAIAICELTVASVAVCAAALGVVHCEKV